MGATLQMNVRRSAFGLLGHIATERSAKLASQIFSTPKSRPFTANDRALLATGQPLTLECNLAATVWESDKTASGETILLVHGWQRHRASLGKFVQPLVASGKRVVAFDAPAHGDSPGKQTNPLEYAKAILAVGKELGNLDGIIAHSMGGGATLIALSQGLQAKRIVLLASAADWEYQMRFFAKYLGMPHKAATRLVRLLESQVQGDVQKLNSAYVCKNLSQPALLFHDPEDARVPYQDSVAISQQMRQAKLVTVNGLGHAGVLEDVDVIRQSTTFLSEAN
jgi:pimeloyl-ACP methyl ester carboxylesterase